MDTIQFVLFISVIVVAVGFVPFNLIGRVFLRNRNNSNDEEG